MGLVARRAEAAGWILLVAAGALAGCSSPGDRVVVPPVPPASTVRTVPNPEREALQFREVEGIVPYAGPTTPTTATGSLPATCEGGKLITPETRIATTDLVVLPDRARTSCYVMGPVLLTGRNVAGARAIVNDQTAQWEINLHFANDDFVTKVAGPEVGRQVAIILDGVVESAPTVNPGITGTDITIAGAFSASEARDIAKKLS